MSEKIKAVVDIPQFGIKRGDYLPASLPQSRVTAYLRRGWAVAEKVKSDVPEIQDEAPAKPAPKRKYTRKAKS